MKKQPFNFDVQIPDLIDFGTRFPQYGPFARENGNFMFDEIMTPSSFIRCKCASEFNLPAVTGVAEICFNAASQQNTVQFNGYLKQYIGALVCSLMEANGYKKSGKKKSVPHHAFTKGEFYQKL